MFERHSAGHGLEAIPKRNGDGKGRAGGEDAAIKRTTTARKKGTGKKGTGTFLVSFCGVIACEFIRKKRAG